MPLNIDLTDVAVEGLSFDRSTCTLTPDLGCGLTLQAVGGVDTIAVDFEQLASNPAETGLIVLEPEEGCPSLAVDVDAATTVIETLVNDVDLAFLAGKLRMTKTRTTYANDRNAAGHLVNRRVVLAPAVTTQNVGFSETGQGFCAAVECCQADPLEASAGASPGAGAAPLLVWFTGSVSGGVPPHSYTWNFGDGPASTDQNPTHVFTAPGSYEVTLTATDSCGSVVTSSTVVTVSGSLPVVCDSLPQQLTIAVRTNCSPGVPSPLTAARSGGVWTAGATTACAPLGWSVALACVDGALTWHVTDGGGTYSGSVTVTSASPLAGHFSYTPAGSSCCTGQALTFDVAE